MSEDIKPIADENGIKSVGDAVKNIADKMSEANNAGGGFGASRRAFKMHANQADLEKHQWDTGLTHLASEAALNRTHVASEANLARTHNQTQFESMLEHADVSRGEFNEYGPSFTKIKSSRARAKTAPKLVPGTIVPEPKPAASKPAAPKPASRRRAPK